MDIIKWGSLLDTFRVEENLPENEKAFKLWKMLIFAKKSRDGLFLVIGRILKQIRDERLYKQLDFRNFKEFIASEEVSFSRETAYMYIKTYEYYIETMQLDPEFIGQMDISRLSRMVPFLKKVNNKEKVVYHIKRLAKLRHGDFIKEVQLKQNTRYKPSVRYDEESDRWIVTYWSNKTSFVDLGDYQNEEFVSELQDDINL